MSTAFSIFLISAAIVALLLGRAIYVVRSERGTRVRGSAPGKGHHVSHADYSSGFSGHSTSYKIPKDPQDYARRFVPQRSKDRK